MDYGEEKMKRYCSTGGLGDSFIVASKLIEQRAKSNEDFDWLHIESVDLQPAFDDLMKHLRLIPEKGFNHQFVHDPQYIEHYKDKQWRDRKPISSGVDSFCPLKGECEDRLENPYLICDNIQKYERDYDVAIQVAGGVGNNRLFRFSPLALAQLLRDKGFRVALVGNAKIFEKEDDKDNFVNKLTLPQTMEIVSLSKRFVSLSGLLTYFALAAKVLTIYLEESPEHTKRYIHPNLVKWSYPIKFGSIQEVKKELERLAVKF